MTHAHTLHYISEAIQRPLMIWEQKLVVIANVLEGRIGLDASGLQHLVDEKMLSRVNGPSANRFEGDVVPADPEKPYGKRKPYRVSGNTAIISVHGSLVNRGAWIGSYSGMTSYEGLRHQLESAGRDGSISNILLDVDSPGGEAIGALETGQVVRSLDNVKPVYAFVNGLCCSAAYAIASGARRIETSKTSILGSIGVVMMHLDQSARIHAAGVKPTFIFAGEHKVDGNPFEPLSASVRSDFQASVDKFYDLFVQHVASNRKPSGLNAKAVREQKARTFDGDDAVKNKLADAIGTFENTLSGIRRNKTRTMKMDNNEPIYSAEQHAALVNTAVSNARTETTQSVTASLTAEHSAAMSAAVATARVEGATAERERINAINSLPEAKGKEGTAHHLAMTTDMGVDQVKGVLAGVPAASAAPKSGGSGIGLSIEKPKEAAASGSWDNALSRAGAKMPEKAT